MQTKIQQLKKDIKTLENTTDRAGLGEYINGLYKQLETLELEARDQLTENILKAIETVAIDFMQGADFVDIDPLNENDLTECAETIADVLITVKKQNTI